MRRVKGLSYWDSKVKGVTSITIGIDASNLRGGGGVAHLVEFLRAAQPALVGIERVIVWGGAHTLSLLDDQAWLEKLAPPELDKSLAQRTLWQRLRLSQAARNEGCHVLFVPGGSYAGRFRPVVTMMRHLLE